MKTESKNKVPAGGPQQEKHPSAFGNNPRKIEKDEDDSNAAPPFGKKKA